VRVSLYFLCVVICPPVIVVSQDWFLTAAIAAIVVTAGADAIATAIKDRE